MLKHDVVLAAAVVATVAAAIVARALAKRSFEQRVLSRLPPGTDGVISGAGAIDRPADGRQSPAALLLHGFGDTPQTLAYLAASLSERGWAVRAPLLPGHGRTLTAWSRTGPEEWLAAARSELDAIRRAHDSVALVGLSMGAALATLVAAEVATGDATGQAAARGAAAGPGAAPPDGEPGLGRLDSLVLLAPYFALPASVRWVAAVHPLVAAAMPYVSARGSYSILDPVERARSLAYGATTPRLLRALGTVARAAWAALPQIAVPTLIVQSHADNRTTPAIAEGALARLGAAEKRLVWVDQGGHVITVDHGHAAVASWVGEWIDAHTHAEARARKVRPA